MNREKQEEKQMIKDNLIIMCALGTLILVCWIAAMLMILADVQMYG